jgi:transglutaminase-like putative cysteine protease
MLPAPSRVVLLYGRTDKLNGDLSFLWSEWHTTVEVFGDGKWYVADPTFGFAYVKDRQGKRLDTAELIKEISDGRSASLTFGVLSGDQIHDLSGDRMLQAQPTLAALYYTSDKQPKYLSVTQPTTIN